MFKRIQVKDWDQARWVTIETEVATMVRTLCSDTEIYWKQLTGQTTLLVHHWDSKGSPIATTDEQKEAFKQRSAQMNAAWTLVLGESDWFRSTPKSVPQTHEVEVQTLAALPR